MFSVKKISLFFKTSVSLITFAKQFMKSAFMKKKKTLLAIEKWQELKWKEKKMNLNKGETMGFKNYVPQ